METLICIEDCYPIKHFYLLKKGTLIEDYYEGDTYYANYLNTWIICKDGYQLLYNKDNFKKLVEYRETQIDKILT